MFKWGLSEDDKCDNGRVTRQKTFTQMPTTIKKKNV